MNPRRDASFIVRVWWEQCAGGSLWRGQVIHAATGKTLYFDRLEDIQPFICWWSGIAPEPQEGEAALRGEGEKEESHAPG